MLPWSCAGPAAAPAPWTCDRRLPRPRCAPLRAFPRRDDAGAFRQGYAFEPLKAGVAQPRVMLAFGVGLTVLIDVHKEEIAGDGFQRRQPGVVEHLADDIERPTRDEDLADMVKGTASV